MSGLGRRFHRLGWWGREGVPVVLVVLVTCAALAGLLAVAAGHSGPAVRGYTEFQARRGGCFMITQQSLNAVGCRYLSPNVYELSFERDIHDSTPVAALGSCCPGTVMASVKSAHTVIVSFRPLRGYPVRAQVVVP
jgi:hypothetical protein